MFWLLAVVVGVPGSAMASAPDAGTAKDPAPHAESQGVRGRDGRTRGTREQTKFALIIAASAVGVYVAYRMIRR